MNPNEMRTRLQQVAQRRLQKKTHTTESDDLVWAAKWMECEPAQLLLEFSRMVNSNERVPNPLMRWLADAFEASMLKPAEYRANELLIELGLQRRDGGRPLVKSPINGTKARLLRIEHMLGKSRGMTIRVLAKKYGVSPTTIHGRLNKPQPQATPTDIEDILRGLALAQRCMKG